MSYCEKHFTDSHNLGQMKILKTLAIIFILGGSSAYFIGCQPPPTISFDPDLTGTIIGPYSGNYVVNYETDPQKNFSSQINLVISAVDKTTIRIDAQGGDSFECTISGSLNSLVLKDIKNTKGVYSLADHLDGAFINGRLYYKVTGTSNGGAFYAEFTVI